MVDPARPIPGGPHVQFHVTVRGEQFPLSVERQVVGIAETDRHQFQPPAVEVRFADRAPQAMLLVPGAVTEVHLPQQAVLLPHFRDKGVGPLTLREVLVPADQVQRVPVRSENYGVAPVLHVAVHGNKLLNMIELVVPVGVPQAKQSGRVDVPVHHRVQGPLRKEQTLVPNKLTFSRSTFGLVIDSSTVGNVRRYRPRFSSEAISRPWSSMVRQTQDPWVDSGTA